MISQTMRKNMRREFFVLSLAALLVMGVPETVNAQRGNRRENARGQVQTSTDNGESATRRTVPVNCSGSVQQRQNSVTRRPQTTPSSGNQMQVRQQNAIRRPAARPSNSGTRVQQRQGTVNTRREQQLVDPSGRVDKSGVESRRDVSRGNSNATVVERNNRNNGSFHIGDNNSSMGGRGTRANGQNDVHVRPEAPHPGYSYSAPTPRGYVPNGCPPHGYRFTPPPVGYGCPVGYRVNTPPPPRARHYDFRGMRYYFYDCCFHALINGVYQVVAAPIGLTALVLPSGYETLLFNNSFYYYYDGAFYRSYGTHYEIVAPRIGMTVSYLPNYGVSYVMYGNRPAYYYNGYYYYEMDTPVGLVYRVVGRYMPY